MGVVFSLHDQASQPAAQAGRSITNLESAVTNASNAIQNASSKITNGIFAVVTTVAMLLGPFATAVNASADFNFIIAEAGAKSQATAVQMDMLKQKAIELGDATIFSAKEVAEAEVILSRAGFAVEQTMQLLPGLVDMAAAGNINLATAADITGNIIYQFGLAAADAGRVGDVIVMAANKSNQSIENFGQAMKYFGPNAKMFGISLEEAAGYIEMMANSGMRGSIGARAFGTSLANLASPSKQAAEMMEAIGFSAYDTAGNFIGLENLIRRLQVSVKGLTNQERDMALSVIFGNEALQEINQLLTLEYRAIENGTEVIYKGADALRYFTNQNKNAMGVSSETSKRMLDNLKGDLILLDSVWETLIIAIGDALENSLRPVTQELTQWLGYIKELINTPFGKWVVTVAAGIAALASGMIVLGFVITVLIPAIWSMVTAVGALMIELAPVIAAVGVMVGLFLIARKAIEEFKQFMDGEAQATGFMGFLQRLGGVLMAVFEIWTSWNGETFTLSQGLHDALQRIGILDFVLDLATWIVRMKEFFMGVVEGVIFMWVIIEEVFGYVRDSFNSLFDALNDAGLGIGKLGGNLELFRTMGMAASFIVTALARPFIVLGTIIGAVANTVEFLVTNLKELGKLFDMQAWMSGITTGMVTGDWSYLPGAGFKNTFADKGKMLPGADATGNFNLDALLNRQSQIMTSLGLNNPTRTASGAGPEPMATNQGPWHIQLTMDGDTVAEKVIDKMALKNARQ